MARHRHGHSGHMNRHEEHQSGHKERRQGGHRARSPQQPGASEVSEAGATQADEEAFAPPPNVAAAIMAANAETRKLKLRNLGPPLRRHPGQAGAGHSSKQRHARNAKAAHSRKSQAHKAHTGVKLPVPESRREKEREFRDLNGGGMDSDAAELRDESEKLSQLEKGARAFEAALMSLI